MTDKTDTARFAAIGEQAAVLAHDLSQPMNIIRMAAEAALMTAEPKDEATRGTFELILTQAGLMGDILDRMRALSVPEPENNPSVPASRPDEQADAVAPPICLGHILAVDDDPSAIRILSDYLGSLGYQVTTAYDGEEAFAKFLDEPPDIVITDMRMPRCDGETLIARIHESIPNFPVVLLTGESERGDRKTSDGTGISPAATLTKPVSLGILAGLIKRLLLVTDR